MDDKLKNQQVIDYDPELCTGCRHFEIACAFKHYGSVDLSKSYLRILFNGDNGAGTFEAVNCQHCAEPIRHPWNPLRDNPKLAYTDTKPDPIPLSNYFG